ncbi:MAG: hypothetical protein CMJ18_13060 [Phycisphaeraceae bacterium]|nr:hypothetical protein [Phycisphaeraceae bacterium]
MKTTVLSAAIAACTFMSGTAFGQVAPALILFEVHVDVDVEGPNDQTARLQSIPIDSEFVSIDLDTGATSVRYGGVVAESTFTQGPLLQGAFFTVDGNGVIQPGPPGGPPLIADLDLVSTLGGPFQLTLGGDADLNTGFLDFSLLGPPALVPSLPGVSIVGHRITPEPGSLVLLGLATAATVCARGRRCA